MLRRILKAAQREYSETVKTKTFILSLLFVPILIGGIMYFTYRIGQEKPKKQSVRQVLVIDMTGQLSAAVTKAFDTYNENHPDRKVKLSEPVSSDGSEERIDGIKERLRKKQLDILAVIEKDVILEAGKIRFYVCDSKAAQFETTDMIESWLRRLIVDQRYAHYEIDRKLADRLRHVSTEHIELSASRKGEKVKNKFERITSMMVPFYFMYLMFMGIFVMGQHMLTSIIEEKSSRVIEVLLSAMSPFELMAGKIVGLAGIGLTVMGIWTAAVYGTARSQGMDIPIAPMMIFYFVIYYVFGFLLFCSILAGIGSICNTIKEAQNLMMPVTLMFVLPLVSWVKLVQDPNGAMATVLSYVPPLTPMMMILRISASSEISATEIVLSMAVLVLSVPIVVWMGAKVFRTGILMYGKRPGIREVWRWLLAK